MMMEPSAGASVPLVPDVELRVVADATPPETLRDLIAAMAVIDQLSPEQVEALQKLDPAKLLGDIKDKVDDVYYVLKRMDAVAFFLKAYTDPIVKKRLTIQKAHDRLWDYVSTAMRGDWLPEDQRQRTEMLPGNVMKVTLRDSPPSLNITRPATASDMERFPEFCEMRRSYVWKNDAVKEALLDGRLVPMKPGVPVLEHEGEGLLCDFAEITRGCWPDFAVRVPDQIEKPKKGAKKK